MPRVRARHLRVKPERRGVVGISLHTSRQRVRRIQEAMETKVIEPLALDIAHVSQERFRESFPDGREEGRGNYTTTLFLIDRIVPLSVRAGNN